MNQTIETLLNHRSIRKFKEKAISSEIIHTLVDVAQHTATSNFMQSYSIIGITDQQVKAQIAKIGNQPYIAESAHLFIFVVDQHRNAQIAKENGAEDVLVSGSMDRFMIGYSDALLATQNMIVAAESLGLGTVCLGSILNDAKEMIQLLKLPQYTFPVLGLAIGYPDQEPQLKPRLPMNIVYHENAYQEIGNFSEELAAYNAEVETYYDLRDANKRIDSFSKQITASMDRKPAGRMALLDYLKEQGFLQ
ncbi:oxygen-insensitive NADPH nitroreductase [Isobaculum melis]|uniref:FMN reductase (NADPH) n=1 Tax=Isobaculum melis TaxID=142588 RepID=A0A1H9RSM6_9LACT|nr:oxygen-insensitive NADPH nitroreductase [Isobaculum melis]SER75455.1 FMN reductase (NADPH) [Isobaculum melis]